MPFSSEWAPLTDALIILCKMAADDLRPLHRDTKPFLHKIDRRQDGKIGIPFAASGPADLTDGS